ncbi:MAG: hypothetical protein KatS3mg027_1068 [Bacteroidia bacterium]|nr:MAG: hypothetical protein KatS3mg027_1068 [Bacteroidia bacterium]
MANVLIKFFGIARDISNKDEETMTFDGTLKSFIEHVYQVYPLLNNPKIQVIFNMKLLPKDELKNGNSIVLKDGDEIAFLPPFAGG